MTAAPMDDLEAQGYSQQYLDVDPPRVCVSCGRVIGPRESYTDGFTTGRVWCHRQPCIEQASNE